MSCRMFQTQILLYFTPTYISFFLYVMREAKGKKCLHRINVVCKQSSFLCTRNMHANSSISKNNSMNLFQVCASSSRSPVAKLTQKNTDENEKPCEFSVTWFSSMSFPRLYRVHRS